MKVLLINPWAVNNDGHYANGMIQSLRKKVQLDFATNYYYSGMDAGKVYRFFFKLSEKMKKGRLRTIIRGLEYILAYWKLCQLVKKNRYDIVHIHWLLMYRVDKLFLPILKKYCGRLILTAHNVTPHVNGDKQINILRDLYSKFDKILVHGKSIKDEFNYYFPGNEEKLIIQRHGTYLQQDVSFNRDQVDPDLAKKVEKYPRCLIMFGNQFYNKGTDRLVKIWVKKYTGTDTLLIIAGKVNGSYPELEQYEPFMAESDNVLFFKYYLDNNTLNYLIHKSDCILLPYRHASMSGVVFTAAEFGKPVLCTKTGALYEYLEDGSDSVVCDNTDEAFEDKLDHIMNSFDKTALDEMGRTLSNNISRKYAWNVIVDQLIQDAYTGD